MVSVGGDLPGRPGNLADVAWPMASSPSSSGLMALRADQGNAAVNGDAFFDCGARRGKRVIRAEFLS